MDSPEDDVTKADILVVDDILANLRVLFQMLSDQSYKVRGAPNGSMALTAVRSAPPDLILLDINMPKMDGYEVCLRLKAEPESREIPVIFISALDEPLDKVKAFGVGGVDYITKPFQIEEVLARIETHLSIRNLQKELQEANEHLERRVEERTRELHLRLQELEARDELLRHLLSLQDPEESLSLAIRLAMDLCNCDAGALYAPDGDDGIKLMAAVGFLEAGSRVPKEELQNIGLEQTKAVTQAFREAVKRGTRVWVKDPDEVRRGFAINSLGFLPVYRGEDVLALLEVDRMKKDVLVGEADIKSLNGFLPYVAMAVTECKLQEEIPGWQDGVEQVLSATEKWME